MATTDNRDPAGCEQAGYEQAMVLLAGRADEPQLDELRRLAAAPNTLIVAADGGALNAAAAGITPHIILGDGDSLPAELFPAVPRRRFPRRKDFSDGSSALLYALENCRGCVTLFGATGGRPDHQLINLLMPLQLPPQYISRIELRDGRCVGQYSVGELELVGKPGDIFSLIILRDVAGLCLVNVEYPLREKEVCVGSSLTLSNIMRGERVLIRHRSGVLLAIRYPAGTDSLY